MPDGIDTVTMTYKDQTVVLKGKNMSASNRPVEVKVDGVIIGSLKIATRYE